MPRFPFSMLLLSLLSFQVMFSACERTDDDLPRQSDIPKIHIEKEYYKGQLNSTQTFEYDDAGRLIKMTRSNNVIDTYTFEPGKVIHRIYYDYTRLTYTDIILLNDRGLATVSGANNYEYNNEGFIIRINETEHLPTVFTISNGNTVKSTKTSGATYSEIKTIKFLPNINTIGTENYGMTWFGKQDKNLVCEEVTRVNDSSGFSYEISYNYTYEYDAQKRVIRKNYFGDISDYYETYTYY